MNRPSPAFVLAAIALFVALSGTTYAATQINGSQLKNGSVATPKIANRAITPPKIRNGAVSTPKIQNGAITMAKLAPSVRRSLQLAAQPGPQGAVGPQGTVGPQGAIGPQGVPGHGGPPGAIDLSRVTTVQGPKMEIAPGVVTAVSATCPPGHRAIGGGFGAGAAQPFGSLQISPGTWTALVSNESSITATVSAVAICLAP